MVIGEKSQSPIFISTHDFFHSIFSPCPVKEGSERDAWWGPGGQPSQPTTSDHSFVKKKLSLMAK